MKNEWTNARINKTCPNCNDSFMGDETVQGETCGTCYYELERCIQCGKDYPPRQMKDNVCLSCRDKEGENEK